MNTKELMLISGTVFMTIIAWVVFEVFAIQQSTPTQEEIDSISLNYNIDVKILDTLREKTP